MGGALRLDLTMTSERHVTEGHCTARRQNSLRYAQQPATQRLLKVKEVKPEPTKAELLPADGLLPDCLTPACSHKVRSHSKLLMTFTLGLCERFDPEPESSRLLSFELCLACCQCMILRSVFEEELAMFCRVSNHIGAMNSL